MKDVDTLVFEGGSVKGLAYVGALQVLDLYSRQQEAKQPFLNQIQRVAGTSAGSIMALLIALKLNLEQIKIIMQNTSFASFEDIKHWYAYGSMGKGAAIYNNGYLCEGLVFLQWAESLLETHAGNKTITFAQLKALTKKDFHVYATRLNDNQTITFNADNTPDVSVALAVRMSMSIPVFFKPVRVNESKDKNGKLIIELDETRGTIYYVDGGVKMNYPYSLVREIVKANNSNLSDQEIDNKIIGFKVDSSNEILQNTVAQASGTYLEPLFIERTQMTQGFGFHLIPLMLNASMSYQDDIHNRNEEESKRTIHSWDCNVSIFDFALDQKKIDALLAAGASAAQTFIQLQNVTLIQNVEAAKQVPEEEKPFAKNYQLNEAKRSDAIAEELKQKIESSPDTVSVVEIQEQLETLKADIERLKNNYRIISQVTIQGKVTEGVDVKIANVSELPEDIEFFNQAIAHVQSAIDKGIYSNVMIGPHSDLPHLKVDIANMDFRKPESTSFLAQRGMFTPRTLVLEEFFQSAKDFLSGLENNVYKEDELIKSLSTKLTNLIDSCKDIENTTKKQRDDIRDKIKRIEERQALLESNQKKTGMKK